MINNYKTIIGSTNVNFRFGHSSILSYFSAIFNFKIDNDIKNIILITSHVYILSFYLFYGLRKILKKKCESFFDQIHIYTLVFILLHIISLNKVGYDIFPLIFIVISMAMITKKKILYVDFLENSLLVVYSIFLKTSVIFYIFIPIIIFLKNIKKFNIKKNLELVLFIITLCLVAILTNFLKSSCLVYPISFSCLDTIWLNKSYGSPENVFLETSAWSKGWANQSIFNYQDYVSNFNWVKNYMQTHFIDKIFFKIILPYTLLISIFLIFKNKIDKKKYPNSINKNYYMLIFFITTISIFSWFISSPDIRYGYTQLVIFFSIVTFFFVLKLNLEIKKILFYLFFILIFQFFCRFFLYQYEVISKDLYKSDYFPNIPEIAIIKKEDLNIPIDNLCWDVKFPCITKESQIDNVNIYQTKHFLIFSSIK